MRSSAAVDQTQWGSIGAWKVWEFYTGRVPGIYLQPYIWGMVADRRKWQQCCPEHKPRMGAGMTEFIFFSHLFLGLLFYKALYIYMEEVDGTVEGTWHVTVSTPCTETPLHAPRASLRAPGATHTADSCEQVYSRAGAVSRLKTWIRFSSAISSCMILGRSVYLTGGFTHV